MKAKLIYGVFGVLPALALSVGGAALAYAGIRAALTGADTRPSSLLFYVVWPLFGILGTVSGCLVLFGIGVGTAVARAVHVVLLCLGIGAAAFLTWSFIPSPASLVPLLPILAGIWLLRSVQRAQPANPADVSAAGEPSSDRQDQAGRQSRG